MRLGARISCYPSRDGQPSFFSSTIPTMPGDSVECLGLAGLPLEQLISSGILQACQFGKYLLEEVTNIYLLSIDSVQHTALWLIITMSWASLGA